MNKMKTSAIWVFIVYMVFFMFSSALAQKSMQVQPIQPRLDQQRVPISPQRVSAPTANQYYLQGNIQEAKAAVNTDKGVQQVPFSGSIIFRLTPIRDTFNISLVSLNLISKGVATGKGYSGTIGLSLATAGEASFNRSTGDLSIPFQLTLHYELIDKMKGFRQSEKSREMDNFIPFTEKMSGRLKARLPKDLRIQEKAQVRFEGEMLMEISQRVIGLFPKMYIKFPYSILELLKSPAQVIKIQPVFVGTGPADPSASGKAFETLKNRAIENWGKCGTVRCLKLVFLDPVYVNNAAYRVLDNETEAISFKGEVNVTDAVEIFVAESMSTSLSCAWGGGATYSSGTASAKIVTSDQQLSVPCPCPTACASYCPLGPCSCGALNNYHLAHELGHVFNLDHPGGWVPGTAGSVMEPSGLCNDNPSQQSAKNCRQTSNPLFTAGTALCFGTPDIMD
jgi:hypothetical protein